MKTEINVQQIAQYRENGFLLIENFLDDIELAVWRDAVTEALEERGGRKLPGKETKTGEDDGINKDADYFGKVFDQMLNLWQTNEKVKQLMLNNDLGKMAADLAGCDGVRIWHDQALVKRPWANPTAWHLDTPFWSFSDRRALSVWDRAGRCDVRKRLPLFYTGSYHSTSFENPGIGKNMDAIFNFIRSSLLSIPSRYP